jgi:hypothetical protein
MPTSRTARNWAQQQEQRKLEGAVPMMLSLEESQRLYDAEVAERRRVQEAEILQQRLMEAERKKKEELAAAIPASSASQVLGGATNTIMTDREKRLAALERRGLK